RFNLQIEMNQSFFFFDLKSKAQRNRSECPITGCKRKPVEIEGKHYCDVHGIGIHADTFTYFNGIDPASKQKAALRNFPQGSRNFIVEHIWGNKQKAESHRLNAENSEDALTWNVFAELHRLGLIHRIYNAMTGEQVSAGSVKLFLWGLEINFSENSVIFWRNLKAIRDQLERGIAKFLTEPDIVLLGPKTLVLIEAKFTSGNPLCMNKETIAGQKPKSRSGLIDRYLNPINGVPCLLQAEDIHKDRVHSQLIRMSIFAHWLSLECRRDWKVVNLVSSTQWGRKLRTQIGYDFFDPTRFLPETVQSRFEFMYWEKLYTDFLVKESKALAIVEYMNKKSAKLEKAFVF
ncbi:MAG TPA: hypothetical protein VH079_04205, partial [Terriglobales bacterium]|nr:hypothetical protein [Terriglobales bacterium]